MISLFRIENIEASYFGVKDPGIIPIKSWLVDVDEAGVVKVVEIEVTTSEIADDVDMVGVVIAELAEELVFEPLITLQNIT